MATSTERTMAPPVQIYMSYEDFLAQYEGVHAEWVDGKVELRVAVTDSHDALGQFLNHLISAFAAAHDLGRVKMPPSQTKLGPDLPGREPDLMFIARERLHVIKEMYVDGPPDLAVEIVSAESRARDYGVKLDEYERAGVREYWIVDPLRDDALFYQRDDQGIFRRIEPDAEGRYHSAVLPGLALEVALLWRDPLPDILEAVELVRAMGRPGT